MRAPRLRDFGRRSRHTGLRPGSPHRSCAAYYGWRWTSASSSLWRCRQGLPQPGAAWSSAPGALRTWSLYFATCLRRRRHGRSVEGYRRAWPPRRGTRRRAEQLPEQSRYGDAGADDGDRLQEHRAVKVRSERCELGAQCIWRDVFAVLGGLADGICEHVRLLSLEASVGQPASEGEGIKHEFKATTASGGGSNGPRPATFPVPARGRCTAAGANGTVPARAQAHQPQGSRGAGERA